MCILYHYTSVDAFMGIFRDCSKDNPNLTMRASHSMFLNDPTEYKLALEICRNALVDVEKELNITTHERLSRTIFSYEELQKLFDSDQIYSTIPELIDWGVPYLFSLSRNQDNLPMWNTYARNGQGIALGFDKYLLETIDGLKIQDCCYNHFLDAAFTKFYNSMQSRWKNLYEDRSRIDQLGVGDLIYKSFLFPEKDFFSRIKHEAYQYENEARCIVKTSTKKDMNNIIKFRIGNNLIIPYIERQIPVSCLKEIVIGPCADKNRLKASLQMFLYNNLVNFNSIKIIDSQIPYRG